MRLTSAYSLASSFRCRVMRVPRSRSVGVTFRICAGGGALRGWRGHAAGSPRQNCWHQQQASHPAPVRSGPVPHKRSPLAPRNAEDRSDSPHPSHTPARLEVVRAGGALPHPLVRVAVALGGHRHPVGHQERRVEAHSKLRRACVHTGSEDRDGLCGEYHGAWKAPRLQSAAHAESRLGCQDVCVGHSSTTRTPVR